MFQDDFIVNPRLCCSDFSWKRDFSNRTHVLAQRTSLKLGGKVARMAMFWTNVSPQLHTSK